MAQNLYDSSKPLDKYSLKGIFITNYFKFTALTEGKETIYKYSISIDPEIPESTCGLKRKVLNIARPSIEKELNFYLYYYNLIFSRTRKMDTLILEVTCDGVIYNMKINYVSELQPFDGEHIHFIKVLMSNLLRKQKFQRIGQKFFDLNRAKPLEGIPLKIWPGYSSSIFGTNTSSFVKIDLVNRVANVSTVLAFIKGIKMNGISRNDFISESLKGKVMYTFYNNRTYRIEGINFSKSPKDEFSLKNNRITFLKYYDQFHSQKIKDLDQPLLLSKTRKGETLELIPELCCLTGLDDEMRKDFHLMKSLSNAFNKKPSIRIEECKKLISQINTNKECQCLLKKWNTNLSDEPLKTEGHIIKPGSLLMKIPIPIESSQGLERDMQQEPKSLAKLSDWAFMYSTRTENCANTFLQNFKNIIMKFKFGFPFPKIIKLEGDSPHEWENKIKALNPEVKLIVGIINGSKGRQNSYNDLKSLLLEKIPIASQFILSKTIEKGNNLFSIIFKIAIQILAKLGGIPWEINEIPFLNKPIMFLGLTIVNKHNHSILCLCASMNPGISKYYSETLIIKGKIDASPQFTDLIKNAIQNFLKLNKILPENIVIYREGLGNNQNKIIENIEVAQIMNMISSNYKEKIPKITFILVNKNGDSKFFLEVKSAPINPPPGSFLSNNFSGKNVDEFYLVSQKTIQGSANPIHYQVLFITNQEKDFLNLLPVISYKLCYLYYHVCGSIRFPAPLRYAMLLGKLLTERKNEILQPILDPNSSNSLYFL